MLIVPALAASVLFQGCSGKKSEGAVQFNDTMSVRALAEQVSGIEILPLEAGELGVSPLAGGIQAIKGDSLYCTMDPYLLKNFPKELLPFLADKNTLSSIPEDGNTVIAIVKLK